MNILRLTDAEILEEAKRLFSAYALKRTLRYHTRRSSREHSESVGEHVFGLIYLAHYFLKVEPSAATLDPKKVYSILLFHDFPEIKHGDVSTYHKTKEHMEREQAAAQEVFESLPTELCNVAFPLWKEYEEHETPEAKFCYALDKLEPLFELMDPVAERSVKDLQITYDMNVSNKFPAVKEFPAMKRFVETISNDMRERGVFWKDEVQNAA